MIDWRTWAVLGLTSALGVACAGPSDPGGGEGSSGSSSEGGSTTAPSTTSSASVGGSGDTTTQAQESSSGSTAMDVSSSSSSASSSSTGPGCEPGTQDCPCDDGVCVDDLLCTGEDVCDTPPNCPQERSEPNDVEGQAPDLGNFNDFDPTFETVDGRLPSADDEDWFSYHCNDTFGGQVDMNYEIDTNIPVRVCQFIACDDPNDPVVVCPQNAESATSPDGLPGCCSELPELFVPDITCNVDDNDDSGTIFVRVDMPFQDMCVSYDLGVHC